MKTSEKSSVSSAKIDDIKSDILLNSSQTLAKTLELVTTVQKAIGWGSVLTEVRSSTLVMTGKNVKDMNSKGVAVELILDKETKATWQKGLEHSIYKASNNKQLQQLCWTDKNGNIRHDNWEYSGDYLIKKNLKNKNSHYESHVAGFDENWLLKIKPTDKKKETGETVTVKQLEDFGWINPTQELADEINEAMSMFGINKGEYATEQIIAFMATTGHESGMGGYDYIQSGGKGKFRGAGVIQLTGEYNYAEFDEYLKENMKGYDGEIMKSSASYKVVAEKYAWVAAAWFWTEGKPIKERLNEYLDKGYKLSDSFIVTSAFVQGFRGSNEDYKKIAAGQYKPINYSSAYDCTYNGQNTYNVIDIKVINGGTVVSSNNWEDRIDTFDDACKSFGGYKYGK